MNHSHVRSKENKSRNCPHTNPDQMSHYLLSGILAFLISYVSFACHSSALKCDFSDMYSNKSAVSIALTTRPPHPCLPESNRKGSMYDRYKQKQKLSSYNCLLSPLTNNRPEVCSRHSGTRSARFSLNGPVADWPDWAPWWEAFFHWKYTYSFSSNLKLDFQTMTEEPVYQWCLILSGKMLPMLC